MANPFESYGSNTASTPRESGARESGTRDAATRERSPSSTELRQVTPAEPAKAFDRDLHEQKVTRRLFSAAGIAAVILLLYGVMQALAPDRPIDPRRMALAEVDTEEVPHDPTLFERLFCRGLSRPSFCERSDR